MSKKKVSLKKQCYVCGKTLSITNFWKDKTRKDGYCGYCRACKDGHKVGYKKRMNITNW